MPKYRVLRSFAGNTRGKHVDGLSASDAKVMLEAGYIAEVGTADKTAKTPRKRAAKKTAAKTTTASAPEVPTES